MQLLCRHCNKTRATRPRGLCWRCYYTPGVRDRFPSTSKFGRWGVGQKPTCALPIPTLGLPGTDEKVQALALRAERGEAIFHPNDAEYREETR